MCRPKAIYTNPCEFGTPLADDLTGSPLTCEIRSEEGHCPDGSDCTAVAGSTQAVCCPRGAPSNVTEESVEEMARPQTS